MKDKKADEPAQDHKIGTIEYSGLDWTDGNYHEVDDDATLEKAVCQVAQATAKNERQ